MPCCWQVISIPKATKQARERNYGLLDELRVLTVHGMLHLLGYDHETPYDAHDMALEETHLLKAMGWRGSGLVDVRSCLTRVEERVLLI